MSDDVLPNWWEMTAMDSGGNQLRVEHAGTPTDWGVVSKTFQAGTLPNAATMDDGAFVGRIVNPSDAPTVPLVNDNHETEIKSPSSFDVDWPPVMPTREQWLTAIAEIKALRAKVARLELALELEREN